ncbi:M67 family metallopeptidase [Caldibacillus lycopersici]|uniref:M67 family metallopeptidase n=1 Tax=Perspicuibacillus lycopersici TaxID=1325689 RepID=A0AAE3IX75_9BACI|nr:M67 family metallopeptidase [Perspicuibacillus lycopersici]MCU9614564.1 M67 family metallopeptidase [Perspicuibacillus lycopersici]
MEKEKAAAVKADKFKLKQAQLVMTSHTYQSIVNHCKMELPLEACGILSGKNGTICSIWPMKNMDYSEVSFSMSVHDIEKVFHLIEAKQEQLLAIYHSHPTAPAIPSPGDIKYHNYPELSYIIVSLKNRKPDVRAYKIVSKQVSPLVIKQID